MTATDKAALAHLIPYGEFADTYLCHIYYKNKDRFMDSVFEKVRRWVEQNGGKITRYPGKVTSGEKKGYLVKIVFPTFGKRDMKNIMAALY